MTMTVYNSMRSREYTLRPRPDNTISRRTYRRLHDTFVTPESLLPRLETWDGKGVFFEETPFGDYDVIIAD